jgi:hypothetical protein
MWNQRQQGLGQYSDLANQLFGGTTYTTSSNFILTSAPTTIAVNASEPKPKIGTNRAWLDKRIAEVCVKL